MDAQVGRVRYIQTGSHTVNRPKTEDVGPGGACAEVGGN